MPSVECLNSMKKRETYINFRKARILTEALIKLAKIGVPYGFPISKMIWAVNLYLETGGFSENWSKYKRISLKAAKIRTQFPQDFRKRITFEHPNPINQIYQELSEQKGNLSLEKAFKIIGAYPAVLITRGENETINKKKLRDKGLPEIRYEDIKINFNLKKRSHASGLKH